MEPTPTYIREVFRRYAEALSEGDSDKILELFSPDAVLIDPIGTAPHVGCEAIRRFFQAGFDQVGGSIQFHPEGDVRIRGKHAGCAFVAICDKAVPPFEVDTLDVGEFDDQGLIVRWIAYVGETNFRPRQEKP